jgi:hypothetical protein
VHMLPTLTAEKLPGQPAPIPGAGSVHVRSRTAQVLDGFEQNAIVLQSGSRLSPYSHSTDVLGHELPGVGSVAGHSGPSEP